MNVWMVWNTMVMEAVWYRSLVKAHVVRNSEMTQMNLYETAFSRLRLLVSGLALMMNTNPT